MLATNSPDNGSGMTLDLGHNLSSDASCAFTGPSSRNNIDPILGVLTNNGGPTMTIALLAGSPAIDEGDNLAALTVDQRGLPRPVGGVVDIGAYEYGYPVIKISLVHGTTAIYVSGLYGQSCRLLTSTTFTDWVSTATNQIGVDGTTTFSIDSSTEQRGFYRVIAP